MDVQYDPKSKPLRGKPFGYLSGRALCNVGVTRFYCVGFLLVVFVIATSLYADRGITRSLSQPMIRKSADYLTLLADDMENNQNQPTINADRADKKSHTNDANTIRVKPAPFDNLLKEEDANPTVNSELGDQVKNTKTLSVINNENQIHTTTEKKKPRLFLHVGPQKTGSSTFQSMLDKLSKLTGELQGDNIYLRHVLPGQGDFNCEVGQWGCYQNCEASEKLKNFIQKARDEGKNLLLTDENLDGNFVSGLRDAIDDKDWDVTVIVVYRRIHEWLISWYNQINKTTNKGSDGEVLFDENGTPYRTEHTKWPDQGGDHIPSFSSWYESFTRDWEPSELPDKHRSIEYYNLYKESFDNVLLYNLHQEADMVTNIICNIIGAANACGKITSHRIDVEKTNGSVNLDNDILSVHAYDMGHIAKTLQRKEVVEEVANYVERSGKVFPRKCNLKMTSEIRTWLVDTEKILVGDQKWLDAEEEKLLKLYESFVSEDKLCDLDKEAVLQDEEWLQFFHSLGKQNKQKIVLHVGPIGGKMIHDTLKTLSGEDGKLQQDGYTLVDIHRDDHFDCTGEDCKASAKLKSLFSSFEDSRKNLIIADDSLDEEFVEAFKEAIDQRKWNLKIVIGYVRLDQLLLMVYNNEYNYENRDLNPLRLIGETESPDKEKHSRWPGEGGTTIPRFNQWFDTFAQESIIQKIMQLSMHLRDLYISSFDDVDFFAYHQRDDLVKDFVCKLVPGATQSCVALNALEIQSSTKKSVGSNYTEADILAVHAHESGLVQNEITREEVRNEVMGKLRSMEKVLSRVCISEVTKQLYDWIIESEKSMIGDKFTSKRIAWINKDFQYFLESGKLCDLDVEKELQEKTWLNFFKNSPKLVPGRDAIS